jgi:hypothetical protein
VSPPDLDVTGSLSAINLKTPKALGLTEPQTILARADDRVKWLANDRFGKRAGLD